MISGRSLARLESSRKKMAKNPKSPNPLLETSSGKSELRERKWLYKMLNFTELFARGWLRLLLQKRLAEDGVHRPFTSGAG